MATTLVELKASIEIAVAPGYRQRLLARGQSRGMIWRDGLLPENAPSFSADLSDNLLSYGYSLLLHGLRFADLGGDPGLARVAFEVAAESLEAVVVRGQANPERGFHRLVAAASYHLGKYSARSYSILHGSLAESNLSVIERGLAKLLLRDLDGLAQDVAAWFGSGEGSDETLIASLMASVDAAVEGGEEASAEVDGRILSAMTTAVDGSFMAAMSQVLIALERGDETLLKQALERLRAGLDVAGELGLVSQWWIHRLAIHLVDGLWATSFHEVLPVSGPPGAEVGDWVRLRKIFISSLCRRRRAEIELWPSQIQAAKRVLDFDVNLVLSLPTSAGKTRIAELCILACIARKKRVVFVTPLRALSAQTEISLRKTFGPLGKTVSSLYGSIGVSGTDVDALRSRDIVVATPEKLDFALRSDPNLLDDVGLVVLDEGHMIGLGEREVRYEAQIQRLLRRRDAASRRIVCLSAILPDGDQLQDFTAWLTHDRADGLIKSDWRPTRLRFGEVDWKGQHGQLNVTVGDEKPFVPRFVVGRKPTKGRGTKTFPSNQTELCIATAWRLMEDGQTVLVFCPIRRSVLPFAKSIIEMHKRGHIESVLEQPESVLAAALAVGAEWFGADHEILACLRLGVAVHHGELPSPYRKEVERLLRDGTLRLTVSSPTLAQGLNLAATSLVFHGMKRNGEPLDISEFRNVVGRAGRAYVDIEGLVLYPMFDGHATRRADWQGLIASEKGREMESGIAQLVFSLLLRMARKLGTDDPTQLIDYVAGQGAWEFPEVGGESESEESQARNEWQGYLTSLDTAIFSLLGDTPIADDEVEAKLDEILTSSLFMRRLARIEDGTSRALVTGLTSRAKHIWKNSTSLERRGYFLAGVGLATGKELDNRAAELEKLLITANFAIGNGELDLAVDAITDFADIAFLVSPFTPKKLPPGWKEILRIWLVGSPLTEIEGDSGDEAVSLIEHAFAYNLPWAMEAVRVRAEAHEDPFSDEVKLSDFSRSHAVAALETGTLSISAATLIQAGFASRLAAIKAVVGTSARFDSMQGLMAWLDSEEVRALSSDSLWPTPESHELWLRFIEPTTTRVAETWSTVSRECPVKWHGVPMPPGTPLRLGGVPGKERSVFTFDYREVGTLPWSPNPEAAGIAMATATGASDSISLEYIRRPPAFE